MGGAGYGPVDAGKLAAAGLFPGPDPGGDVFVAVAHTLPCRKPSGIFSVIDMDDCSRTGPVTHCPVSAAPSWDVENGRCSRLDSAADSPGVPAPLPRNPRPVPRR